MFCILGSPYRALISSEILKLQEEGILYFLKEKWWASSGKCKDEDKKTTSASELGLPNVGGVFVVLLAGLGMAAIIAVFEFIWRTKKIPRDERVGFHFYKKRFFSTSILKYLRNFGYYIRLMGGTLFEIIFWTKFTLWVKFY